MWVRHKKHRYLYYSISKMSQALIVIVRDVTRKSYAGTMPLGTGTSIVV